MKRNAFPFSAALVLVLILGLALSPELSLSQTTAPLVSWRGFPGTTPRTLATCWHPIDGELYVVAVGLDGSLWCGSFNAIGDFNNNWEALPGKAGSTGNPSASLSWNPATQEMYLMVPAEGGSLWVTTVNSSKPNTQHTISGNVKDATGQPLSGAVIDAALDTFYLKSAKTDSSGNYTLSLRDGFSYILTAQKADGITQVGSSQTVPPTGLLNADQTNINFAETQIGTPPDSIRLDKIAYGYIYGLQRYSMVAGQVQSFILPVGDVIASGGYPFPGLGITRLWIYIAPMPDGSGLLSLKLTAPTGEVYTSSNIYDGSNSITVWSNKFPSGGANYNHDYIDQRDWILEIKAIKDTTMILWWWPSPDNR